MEFMIRKAFQNILGGLQWPKRKIQLFSVAFNTLKKQSSGFFNLVTLFSEKLGGMHPEYVRIICELYAFSHVLGH